jgi:hypothetical protein
MHSFASGQGGVYLLYLHSFAFKYRYILYMHGLRRAADGGQTAGYC